MSKRDSLFFGFESGCLNRRDFFQGATALGISIGAASAFAKKVDAATPKKGGDMIFGLAGASTSDNMDPDLVPDNFVMTMKRGIYNTLTEISPDGELIGELAEDWEASSDAKQWRFKLRNGVEFHNGKTLSVEDVIASFNTHRAEESKSPMKGQLGAVTDIEADGDTVIFKLDSGNADFASLVSDFALGIMPAVDGKADWKSAVGTGAYILTEFEPGVRASTKRNPNYFKDGRGHFDTVTAIALNDDNARVSAMLTGEVHSVNRLNPKIAKRLGGTPNVDLAIITGPGHYVFEMNMGMDPVSNNHVRLALKHAIDRDAFVQTILGGFGSIANDQPIGPTYQYHDPTLPQRGYDPDKAKYHLKEAGLSSLSINLHAADAAFTGSVDAAAIYSEQASKAGVSIKPVREPNDGYWSNIWGKKIWFAGWWGGRPTEDAILSLAYHSKADWNATGFKNERFDSLLLQARGELDKSIRAEMYAETQRILHNDGGTVIPAFFQSIDAVSTKVGTLGISKAIYGTSDLRAFERWWFK